MVEVYCSKNDSLFLYTAVVMVIARSGPAQEQQSSI